MDDGRKDEFGFTFYKDGTFLNDRGVWFYADRYDDHGNYYDENWNYHSAHQRNHH